MWKLYSQGYQQGLESKLGDMQEEADAKQNTAVESLVKEFGTLMYP